jgi:hypothetical protein
MKTFLTLSSQLLIAFLILVSSSLQSQSPLGIPYQAVMRNADGSVMASSSVSLTFMIHDATANGNVVYQESHALTSNAQGLVSCVMGNGVVSQGNFANINWGGGAKFLQVMMGSTDLGTQQMLSVPYALFAEDVGVRVSVTGDSLFIGDKVSIVPGVSAANDIQVGDLYQGGYVAYLFQPGDFGYIANERHGLIVSTEDLGDAQWGCYQTFVVGTEYGLGLGDENTTSILSYSCGLNNTAAKLCVDYVSNGYIDWYLPSFDELMLIYINLHSSISFSYYPYWTSTQDSNSWAKSIGFDNDGSNGHSTKDSILKVRAIRYF